MFIFYSNDIMNNIGELRVNMFADDCLIYSIGNTWETIVPKIQNGLISFQQWCFNNRMKVNVKKSKTLVIGTNFKLRDINMENRFKLNDIPLENVNNYNYLGIILNSNMNLSALFSKVVRSVTIKIYNLIK